MNNNYESEIEELAKAIYETKVCIDGTDVLYGVFAKDDHYHKMARALYAMGYRKDSDVVKEALEPIYTAIDSIPDYWYYGEFESLLCDKSREYGVELKANHKAD